MKKIIYILICFIICCTNFFAFSKEKKNILLIRDSEIEFFLQNLINDILIIKNKEKNSIIPRILLNDQVNAFVTSGNKIYINTGLLQNVSSIEEIQGIIAHEIGHLDLGHFQSRKVFQNKNSNRLSLAFLTMLSLSLSQSETDLSGLILVTKDLSLKNQSRYNKQQEMEADIYAIKTLKQLNLSLIGLKNFFEKVDGRHKVLSNENFNNYYSSHPSPENRKELINNFTNPSNNSTTNSINFSKFKIQLDQIKIKVHVIAKDKNKIMLSNKYKDNFLKKYLIIAKNYLDGDLNQALNNINSIIEMNNSNPYLFEIRGNLNLELNKIDKAIESYTKAIKLTEDLNIKSNSLIKLSLARALIENDNEQNLLKALKILEELIPFEKSTSFLWRLIAKASGKLKMQSITYIALAEEQVIKNNLKKAKKYASLGLKDNNISIFYKLRGKDILSLNN